MTFKPPARTREPHQWDIIKNDGGVAGKLSDYWHSSQIELQPVSENIIIIKAEPALVQNVVSKTHCRQDKYSGLAAGEFAINRPWRHCSPRTRVEDHVRRPYKTHADGNTVSQARCIARTTTLLSSSSRGRLRSRHDHQRWALPLTHIRYPTSVLLANHPP